MLADSPATGRPPLKVAFGATALLSPLTGIGQYTFHLAAGLQRRSDLEVDFFYGDHFSTEMKDKASPMKGKLQVLVRHLIPNAYAIHRALQQGHFNRCIRQKHFDVYHEPNYLALPFAGPTLITVHDLSWIRYPETHPAERVRAMNRYFEPALRRASLLLTDSEFVKREIVEVFGIDPSRIFPIPLGLDPMFQPMTPDETQEVLARHGLVHGEYFLSVGTLEPRKNMEATVAAYARLPQALRSRHSLVLAGMRGWRTGPLERLLGPLVQKGHVVMLGYLGRSDLAAVTAGALSMVYPSLYEGFGLPPLEAMGCGVPPITSNVSSLPEVVGDGGLTIDPHDTVALSDAMELMASDPVQRALLAARAQARAAQFTWGRCVSQTAEAYHRAATTAR